MKNKKMTRGYFGQFGGQYVPETLMAPLETLEKAYLAISRRKDFQTELLSYLQDYCGRPTPITYAANLSRKCKGANIFLKREDLCHTGAHKINNTIGQVLLARYMKKSRIIAETGAGQHGLATATAARLFNLPCVVYMGAEDVKRQALNVYKMRLLGAQVRSVFSGSQTLKDATNEAIRDWVENVDNTYYVIGSVVGPHPYPAMVRNFQAIIGKEARRQFRSRLKVDPDYLIACVGGGSNALGLFYDFLPTKARLIGVEAAGKGLSTQEHSATLSKGKPGILHGMKSYLLQEGDGQIKLAHSISAGLDYPGVGPEHSFFKDNGRIQYEAITDKEALAAFYLLTREEGIMPALESSHAVAYAVKLARRLKRRQNILVCLSGRGDKDIDIIRHFEANK